MACDVGHGINQQLRGELDAGIAAGDRGGGCEIAAGAVAGNAEALCVAAKFRDAVEDVARRGKGILEGAGKARLRRATIVDGDDDRAGLDRKVACLPVMGLEIARDPAAAVKKHHGRRGIGADTVEARIERASAAFHLDILHRIDRWRRHGRARGSQCAQGITGALWRHRGRIAQRQQRNDLGDDGIERCGHCGSFHGSWSCLRISIDFSRRIGNCRTGLRQGG
ncbi:hypothetical protein ACVINU_005261 [Bradyrhizobium diazoefficiens]